jgi:O-antigen ligase
VARSLVKFRREAIPFWALIIFLVLTFLMGGSSRADTQSLVILRPAAMIFCGIGLWTLRWDHIRENRFLFGMAAAIFGITILHLIPLPSALWGALPGRGMLTEVDKLAELGAVWRPLSMVPLTTKNALHSLFVPLAVLIFGVQLSREERFKLLPVVLGLGLLSGLLAIMQVAGPVDGPLYLYSEGVNGAAEGFFRNRNHQAALLACLFPVLAAYASTAVRSEEQADIKLWLAIGVGVVLVPLILLTGSRAGLAVGVVGLISVKFIYRKPASLMPKKRTRGRFDPRYALGAFAVLCLGGLSILMSRAQAIERLLGQNQSEDGRFTVWVPIAEMAWKYFPFGSGIGTFVEVYQIDEPYALLSPEYYNHAHNDWLEVYMTAGLPGVLLLIVAVAGYWRLSLVAFRTTPADGRSVIFSRMAAIVILILSLASIPDYPLRVPSLSCVFVIAALWLTNGAPRATKKAGRA